MPDTAVFDVDGTLVDTSYPHTLAPPGHQANEMVWLVPTRVCTPHPAAEPRRGSES